MFVNLIQYISVANDAKLKLKLKLTKNEICFKIFTHFSL